MRALSSLVLLALISACASTPATVSEPTPEPVLTEEIASDTEPPPSPVPAELSDAADREFRPADAGADRWYTPLPPASLDALTEDEQTVQRECLENHRVQADDVTDSDLLAGALCMGEDHGAAKQIRIAMILIQRFPESPHVPAALIATGRGYERVGRMADAIEQYEYLLRVFPKHELARVVGQRAVCLARTLPLPDRERELLAQLERLYGGAGFETPTVDELVVVCGEGAVPQT